MPTISESGYPDCATDAWNSIFVPAGTPANAIRKLGTHIPDIVTQLTIQTRLLELGVEGGANLPAEMAALFRNNIAPWNSTIDRAGIERQ